MDENNVTTTSGQQGTAIYVNVPQPQKSNGVGTAGFVISLICLLFSWVPGLSWILWLIGLILSFVGVFKTPRGLAITGLIISCLDLIMILVVISAIASVLALI